MEIAPPVPLPRPGQYQEDSLPVWKIRSYQPAVESLDHTPIFRLQRMPVPAGSSEVYRATEARTVAEMKEYARWTVGLGPEPKHKPAPIEGIDPTRSSLLHFNSRFEGGNLLHAFVLSPSEYQLCLSSDTNSKGHIQWFSFSATPTVPVQAKLHIMNFLKAKCLFATGMRPWCRVQDGPWQRLSDPCEYFPNGVRTSLKSGKEAEFYTLSFTFDFKEPHKTVFFAFAEPYLYTTLQSQLRSLSKHTSFRRQTLCVSLLGFPIDLITITSPSQGENREIVVLTARAHPGETPGSWVMASVLQALCEDEAKALRDKYIFKLVPMLNPDGVVIGNSRTGMEGVDLNRRWKDCTAFPQLEALKGLLRKWQAQGRLALYCDLHGHAKAYNAFLYGCSKGVDEGLSSFTQVRLFPRILAQLCPLFNYSQCSFKVHKSKCSTARVVVWQELGLTPSYTLESSFFGYTTRTGEVREWGREQFAEVGRAIVRALGVYGEVERERKRETEEGGRSQRGEKEFSSIRSYLPSQPSVRFLKSASSIRLRPRQVEATPRKARWRTFFEAEELQRGREGRGLEDLQGSSSGSESDPSEDNLGESEVQGLEKGRLDGALQRKTEVSPEPGKLTEATSATASIHQSISEDTWFTRSTDQFSAGKPQDFLFRSISFFKSLRTPIQSPVIPPLPLYRQREGNTRRTGKRVLLVVPNFKAMRSVKVPTVGSLLGRKTEVPV